MSNTIDSPTVNAYVVGVEIVPPTPPPVTDLPGPRPTITAFLPAVGLAGERFTLRISGTGFTEAVQVRAGGRPANTTIYVSDTVVDAAVDADGIDVGTVIPVSILDVTGESEARPYTFGADDGGGFPVPTLTSIDPDLKGWLGPPFDMTLTGTGFTTDSVVWFDGVAVPSIVYVSATELVAEIDRSRQDADEQVPVWVTGKGGQSNTLTFTFEGQWWPDSEEST